MACQLLEAARFVGLDAQHLQLLLGRAPGEIHGPLGRMGVAVLVHQHQDLLAGRPGGKHQGKTGALSRRQGEAAPQA